jgi:hypothetical protein
VTWRLGSAHLRRIMSEWVLPPAFQLLIMGAATNRRRQSAGQRAVLARNAWLQDAYVGRRCFVLGNGPSLANVDVESLGGEITVVMNAFNRHAALRMWQPVVHCMAEPASAYSTPERIHLLRQFLEGYTSTTHVFPIEMGPLFNRTRILPPNRIAFFEQDGRKAGEFDRIDLTGPLPSPHDTSILAVSVAIAMGCNPIVLLGLDYNWLSHRSVNAHFYDDAAVPWPHEDVGRTPYLSLLRSAQLCWEAHTDLLRIASRSGQTILNATEGSFLDVYPMTTLAAVLSIR